MNKIIHSFQLILICGIVFLLSSHNTAAQDTILNKYGLWVINTIGQLQKTQLHNPAKTTIDLKKKIPSRI